MHEKVSAGLVCSYTPLHFVEPMRKQDSAEPTLTRRSACAHLLSHCVNLVRQGRTSCYPARRFCTSSTALALQDGPHLTHDPPPKRVALNKYMQRAASGDQLASNIFVCSLTKHNPPLGHDIAQRIDDCAPHPLPLRRYLQSPLQLVLAPSRKIPGTMVRDSDISNRRPHLRKQKGVTMAHDVDETI